MERLGPHFDLVIRVSPSSDVAGRHHARAAPFHGTLI